MTVEERLAGLNLALPEPPKPVGNYLPAARVGNLVFTSGQTARINGVRRYVGTVGKEVTRRRPTCRPAMPPSTAWPASSRRWPAWIA